MLKSVFIKNFIFFDLLELDFSSGFNVFTGETGAGKSMIINAIDIALGGKSSREMIKDGAEKAYIELVFLLDESFDKTIFEENGIDFFEEMVISREISQSSSRIRLNGVMISLDLMKRIREKLLDIHSQHENFTYLQHRFHISLLDSYGSAEHKNDLSLYRSKYSTWKNKIALLEKNKESIRELESKKDLLRYQIDEISKADITDFEEDKALEQERRVLINSEKLFEKTCHAYELLDGEELSVRNLLGSVFSELSEACSSDSSISEKLIRLEEVTSSIDELSRELRHYFEDINSDPRRLEGVEERLDLLNLLKRKYGTTLKDVAGYMSEMEKELSMLESSVASIAELELEISELGKELSLQSDRISATRRKLGDELSGILTSEIRKLELPAARFMVDIKPCDNSSSGQDRVEFLISTNVSKSPEPLVKVASGGELSRIMLALKTVFADADDIGTVIFDEIDSGISGKTSQAVADELSLLSKYRQVLAITHQPVIAARADRYIYIEKEQHEKTDIKVFVLDGKDKEEALAIMASGNVTSDSLNFARELLETQI